MSDVTLEQVKELIQELRDDMKSIHTKLHRDHDKDQAEVFHKKMGITDKNIDDYFTD